MISVPISISSTVTGTTIISISVTMNGPVTLVTIVTSDTESGIGGISVSLSAKPECVGWWERWEKGWTEREGLDGERRDGMRGKGRIQREGMDLKGSPQASSHLPHRWALEGEGAAAPHPSSAPTGFFQDYFKSECYFTNGTERVRLVKRCIYNREQYVHFDSDVGVFVADTPLGEPDAKYWNSQEDLLEDERAEVDTFCRHNYEAWTPFTMDCRVQPQVEIHPVQSGSLPQPDRLVCAVTDFYPAEIEVKWFKNGQEEVEGVVSTDVMQNGDWTYQVLVMLETIPQHGETYTCQVEHASLQRPVTQAWELQADGARSKMLTGVGGFVLGFVFLALGLVLYGRNKSS
ncbi:class II histocompatibility antigen, B-L beta chain-like [Phaenicophaeus curvirostris]|uniref:class II histocompatibility antigen, B-L beta chain-like n=1 Tax=Phaenicophaeus curvirostris TaxID=33595 RepID=UPI0037F0B788